MRHALVIDTETARAVDFRSVRGRPWTAPGYRSCGLAQVAWCTVDLARGAIRDVTSAYLNDPTEGEIHNPYARVSQELCDELGQDPAHVAASLARALEGCTEVSGHNVAFDVCVLSSWLAAKGFPEVGERLRSLPTLCTMLLGAARTPGGRWPKLVALCELLGVPTEEAHDARNDVVMAAKCLIELLPPSEQVE